MGRSPFPVRSFGWGFPHRAHRASQAETQLFSEPDTFFASGRFGSTPGLGGRKKGDKVAAGRPHKSEHLEYGRLFQLWFS